MVIESQRIARQKIRMCVIDVMREKQVVIEKFAKDMHLREVSVVTGD